MKTDLTPIANLENEVSAVGQINANFDKIEQAIDNTLSRDGTTPNEMLDELDMNSNKIINLPAATSPTEPVRKAEFDDAVFAALGLAADERGVVTFDGTKAVAREIVGNFGVEVIDGDGFLGNPTVILSDATRGSLDLADSALQTADMGALAFKDQIDVSDINATGTPSGSTFLAGDGSWSPAGVGDMVKVTYDPNNIASDVFGKGLPFNLKADAALATIPAVVQYIRIAGYTTVGLGGALYKKVGAEPTHDGKINSADGAWWEIAERRLDQFMFGAVNDGDGVGGGTNNTTAIQQLFTAASALKQECVLQPGTFRCDTGFTVPAYLQIRAIGTFLDFKNLSSTATAVLFTNGGALRGAKLVGPGSSTFSSTSVGVGVSGTNNHPSAPTFVIAPTVEDCEITAFAGYGIYFAYATDCFVRRNHIHHIGYAGLGGVSCSRIFVRENYIHDITSTGTTNWYGAFIDRKDGLSETSDPRSYDCEFVGNVVANIAWEGLDTHAGVGFRIIGNRLTNCARAIAVVPSQITGGNPIAPRYCIVSGNVLEQSGATKELIVVAGAYSGGTVYEYAKGCVVSGNVLSGGGKTDDSGIGAIHCYATEQLNVTGNTLRWPRRVGICVNFSNLEFNISGNNYLDPYSADGASSCVRVLGTDNRGYIGGETYRFADNSLGTYVAEYAVYVDNTSGVDITIGRSAYLGITSGRLSLGGSGLSACDLTGAWSSSGSTTIATTSGVGFTTISVTFPKRAPMSGGKATAWMTSSYTGTKPPVFRCNNVTATGFNVTIYPATAGNFDVTGSLDISWSATL